MDLEPHGLGTRPLPFDVGDAGRPALHFGLLEVGAQLDRSVRDFEIAQQSADVAGGEPEQGFGLFVDHRHRVVARHDDLGHRVGAKSQIPDRGQAGQVRLAFVHGRSGIVTLRAAVRARGFAEDSVLEVRRRELVTVAQQHLGVPEEQGALRREGKMQAAQNVSLSLGIHVHQRVTTYQQIDPGDGRVPD